MKSSCVALVLVLCSANSESLSIVSDSAWPLTCPDKGSSWNQTACPTTATCCQNGFSGSKYGCCPYPNAVCCNEYMCCPSGTECTSAGGSSYNEIFNCTVKKAKFADGVCTCKPGVPLPVSATKKNVLIIGDSLTIGYTPYVNTALADIAVVQHAPWDTSDGGAEETAYGLQCIAQWLASPSGIPIVADVVYFNFGLHDGPLGNSTVSAVISEDDLLANLIRVGRHGAPTQDFHSLNSSAIVPRIIIIVQVYAPQLRAIASALKVYGATTGAKIIFGLTSAYLCAVQNDGCVRNLNNQAKAIMDDLQIPTVDLHAAITGQCGAAPQPSCFNLTGCFCPHCNAAGYQFLANSAIAPAIRQLLL